MGMALRKTSVFGQVVVEFGDVRRLITTRALTRLETET